MSEQTALLERCRTSDARVIVVCAPGSGTSEIVAGLRSRSDEPPIAVRLNGCRTVEAIDRAFVTATIESQGTPLADGRWLAISAAGDLTDEPLLDAVAGWIRRVSSLVRVILTASTDLAPLLARLERVPLLALGPADLADGSAGTFEIAILDATVRRTGGSVVPIGGRPLEVLMFLALQPAGWADRDLIVDAIWPTLPSDQGVGALKAAAHRIRVALGDPSTVVQSGKGYKLGPALETDLARLERLLSATPPAVAAAEIPRLRAQVAAGIGRLQSGSRWAWFARYAARVEALVRRLAREVAQAAFAAGEPLLAHRVAADLRLLDELDETALEISLEAHRRDGNLGALRREALRHAEAMRAAGIDVSQAGSRLAEDDP